MQERNHIQNVVEEYHVARRKEERVHKKEVDVQ
jgi:hypothetical protein